MKPLSFTVSPPFKLHLPSRRLRHLRPRAARAALAALPGLALEKSMQGEEQRTQREDLATGGAGGCRETGGNPVENHGKMVLNGNWPLVLS